MCSSSFPTLCCGSGFVVYGFMFIWQKNHWGDLESCSFVYKVVLLEREKYKMLWGERAAHDTVEVFIFEDYMNKLRLLILSYSFYSGLPRVYGYIEFSLAFIYLLLFFLGFSFVYIRYSQRLCPFCAFILMDFYYLSKCGCLFLITSLPLGTKNDR